MFKTDIVVLPQDSTFKVQIHRIKPVWRHKDFPRCDLAPRERDSRDFREDLSFGNGKQIDLG